MPRGRKGSGLTKNEKANHETRSYSLELRLDALRAERDHLMGLVDVLRADKEKLRQRVLVAVAGGPICSRCAEETAVPAPQVPVQRRPPAPLEAAAPVPPPTTTPPGPTQLEKFDPA